MTQREKAEKIGELLGEKMTVRQVSKAVNQQGQLYQRLVLGDLVNSAKGKHVWAILSVGECDVRGAEEVPGDSAVRS